MFQNVKIISRNTNAVDYHTEKVPRGDKAYTVSSSMLRLFRQCPSRWLAGYVSPDSESKRFGSLLDCKLLTPQLFSSRFAATPEQYESIGMKCPECESVTDSKSCRKCGCDRKPVRIKKDWNNNATECAEWLELHKGLEIVSAADVADVDAAVKRIRSDEILASFLDASDTQVWLAGEWVDEHTGLKIPVRALLDVVPRLGTEWAKTLGDLKSVRSAALIPFARQVYHLGWHVQAALYTDMYVAATNEDRCSWCFVGAENYEPWQQFRRLLKEDFLMIGRQTYRNALALYAHCLAHDTWPGYDDHRDSFSGWSLVAAEPWMEFESMEAAMEADQARETEPDFETADITP